MEKFNISIVLPIKSSKTIQFEDYFTKAITSIKEQVVQPEEIVIVHTDETKLVEYLDSFDFGDLVVKKLIWKEEPNFCAQVNYGVQNSNSDWVSIFEFDDEYSKIWLKNVKKYSEVYKDTDCFLPIVIDTDEKGVFMGFTNEATFALNLTNEIGLLNNEILQNFQNFQLSGLVIEKEKFIEVGMLKPTVVLTFVYEFFLRLTHNFVKTMTIPKIGYKHTNLREGSIFWNYKNGEKKLSEPEVKFWIETAKKEYFYNKDRNIKFETN
jgi:glycosyltransferase involved in cell wall biosynthesis